MSIPGFGRIMPIHFHVLTLIGWRLSFGDCESEVIVSEPDRLRQMRTGHADLVRATRQDFGYDLAKWRDFLLAHDEEYGYRHPYAFAAVDRAVRAAMTDAQFARLAALAAVGGREWDEEYEGRLDRERQERLDRVAAKDALVTTATCRFCGKPCPSYRLTCKHCGQHVRQ